MSTGHQLIILAACLLMLISTSGQRETFSQRRQKLIDEKRRQQPSLLTTSPGQLTSTDRINEAASDDFSFVLKMMPILHRWDFFHTPLASSMGTLTTSMMVADQANDFRLNMFDAASEKYLKHPDSFRRSLMQIGHESYRAFLIAHNNMNKIRLSTLTMPDYLKAAFDILATGDVQLIQRNLHRLLIVYKKSIDDIVNWSMEVRNAFEQLSRLADEFYRVASKTRIARLIENSDWLRNGGLFIYSVEVSPIGENGMLQTNENSSYRDVLKTFIIHPRPLDVANLEKDKARMRSMHFEGNAMNGVKTVCKNQFKNSSLEDPCIKRNYYPIFTILGRSETLLFHYPTLGSFNSSNGRYNWAKDVAFYKNLLISMSECWPIRQVIETGLETIERMRQLADASKMPHQGQGGSSVLQVPLVCGWRWGSFFCNTYKEITLILKSMENFNAEAKCLASVLIGNVPHSDRKSLAAEQTKANAYYKIASHEEGASLLRPVLERDWKQIVKDTNESIHTLNEIDVSAVSSDGQFTGTPNLGMKEMSQLAVNWYLLYHYFSQLSQLIITINDTHLTDLLNDLETARNAYQLFPTKKGQLENVDIKKIQVKAIAANHAVDLVNNMVSIYSRISSEYLMPRLHTLDHLINSDKSNSMETFAKTIESCVNDALKIKQLIAEEKRRRMENVDARAHHIRQQYVVLDQL